MVPSLLVASTAAGAALLVLRHNEGEPTGTFLLPETTAGKLELSSARGQRLHYGKMLIRPGAALHPEFTFINESSSSLRLGAVHGHPSCCVKGEAIPLGSEIAPGGEFRLKLHVEVPMRPGWHAWRGMAQAPDGSPFLAEATAELIPVVHISWESQPRLEVDAGEDVVWKGVVQYVGHRRPTGAAFESSCADIRWLLGGWTDCGPITDNGDRLWEASIRSDGKTGRPGRCSAANRITLKPSGEHLEFHREWIVRSEWLIEPKAITLSPAEPVGTFEITPRRDGKSSQPSVTAPKRLATDTTPTAKGVALRVRLLNSVGPSLETIAVKIGDEVLSLPVIALKLDDAMKGANR